MNGLCTTQMLKAQVANLADKYSSADAFGICIDILSDNFPDYLDVNGKRYTVIVSKSPLELRSSISNQRESYLAPFILVTDLSDAEVGDDILAYFPRCRLVRPQNWEIAKQLFHARKIDSSLPRFPWLAEELIRLSPSEGYAPVAGGFLSSERAWSEFLERSFGLRGPRVDIKDILQWSLDVGNVDRFSAANPEIKSAAIQQFGLSMGKLGGRLFGAVEAGYGALLVHLGLVAEVLCDENLRDELDAANVRFEQFINGESISSAHLSLWASASIQLIETLPEERTRDMQTRAFELLGKVQAEDFVSLSTYLPQSFEIRLEKLGNAIAKFLSKENLANLVEAERCFVSVNAHRRASLCADRVETARMALRALRWMSETDDVENSFEGNNLRELCNIVSKDAAFIDRIRHWIIRGDSNDKFNRALASLLDALSRARERLNHTFAQQLQKDALVDSTGGVLCVEEVLEKRVLPLAEDHPVLLLLLDGMSYSIFHELMEDVARTDWVFSSPSDVEPVSPMLAAFPTVTEVSRQSLLVGALRSGNSSEEKKGFQSHKGLCRVHSNGHKPILFQKGDISEVSGGRLAESVEKTIQNSKNRVVGVVINAIDDHLQKGEQLWMEWKVRNIPLLANVLDVARTAGRVVVLTSDHGHVLERKTKLNRHNQGERYRADDGNPESGEIRLTGRRVLQPDEGRLIAPWSESLRYTASKKNGYHGGVSPQEVVIPVAIIKPISHEIEGWKEAPLYSPDWWHEPVALKEPEKSTGTKASKLVTTSKVKGSTAKQISRFTEGKSHDAPEPEWIARLLTSPVFESQKRLAGRVAVPEEELKKLLSLLEERGGTALLPLIAQRLAKPRVRIPGFLSTIRRLLNVDGYEVVYFDSDSETVTLNKSYLFEQFELK